MGRKLIKNGGDSFTEAVKNVENATLDVVPSKARCEYVISNVDHMAGPVGEAESEKDEYEKFLFKGDSGGAVVFSTDVNSLKLADGALRNWLIQKFRTVRNRITARKVLDGIRRKNNIYAWTIGRYFVGVYTGADGKTFSENSYVVDCIGVDRKTLFRLAEEIRAAFGQESVLVKDHATSQVYFVS